MTERSLDTRERIVSAAASLLTDGGRDAVSTRAVSAAAGVQAPTIYRLFGDMRGLLDAVMSRGFAAYLTEKTTRERAADPVEDLRRGWDLHVGFGVANPALYALIYGDPRPDAPPAAARAAAEVLAGLVHRVAAAGRLRMDAELAAQVVHAAGCGVTLTLISMAPELRDPALSATTREAVLAAVTTSPASTGPVSTGPVSTGPGAAGPVSTSPGSAVGETVGGGLVGHAVALKANLASGCDQLSTAEQGLLVEWLDRLGRAPQDGRTQLNGNA